MNILIVGNSTLARAVQPLLFSHNVSIVGRQDYDLSLQADCDLLVKHHAHKTDCVVFTQAVMDKDIWNSITVNYTSVVYLITKFYEHMNKGQIIAVSSCSSNWQSWPGIDMHRMLYGSAKASLTQFCANLNRKNVPDQAEKEISIQVYEPNSFASPMSNTEHPITDAAKDLHTLIKDPRISMLQGLNR